MGVPRTLFSMLWANQPCTPITTIRRTPSQPRHFQRRRSPATRCVRGIDCSCSACKCGAAAPLPEGWSSAGPAGFWLRFSCSTLSGGVWKKSVLIALQVRSQMPTRCGHERGACSNVSEKLGSTMLGARGPDSDSLLCVGVGRSAVGVEAALAGSLLDAAAPLGAAGGDLLCEYQGIHRPKSPSFAAAEGLPSVDGSLGSWRTGVSDSGALGEVAAGADATLSASTRTRLAGLSCATLGSARLPPNGSQPTMRNTNKMLPHMLQDNRWGSSDHVPVEVA